MTEDMRVKTLDEVLVLIGKCQYYDAPIYRGHSNREYPLESAAVRRLKHSYKIQPSDTALIDYHVETLIDNAKNMHYHYDENGSILSDLELLAKLQHQGAATSLMDFTRNIGVALWFACQNLGCDGVIYVIKDETNIEVFQRATSLVLNKSIREIFEATRGGKFYIWEPPGLKTRILQQDSVFVFGLNEEKLEHRADKIIIDKNIKKAILELLEKAFNISLATLFKDFDGFAMAHGRMETLATSKSKRLFLQGNEYFQEQNYRKAIEIYQKVIEIDPRFIEAYFPLARIYCHLEQYAEAIKCHERVIKIDPSNGKAKRSLDTIRSVCKEMENIRNKPSPSAYCSLGNKLAKLEDYPRAIANYKKALELDPSHYGAHFRSGVAYTKLKEYIKAVDYYKHCLKINPSDWRVYISLSYAYQGIGEHGKSERCIRKSQKIRKLKGLTTSTE